MSPSTKIPDAQTIRDGLFLASSRSYGEQYIEPLIRAKYALKESDSNDYDARDAQGKRYEIKACKVLKATHNARKSKSLVDRILFEHTNLAMHRLVPFAECEQDDYLANVQNVKRDHFDVLIYVLLFSDCVKVFFARKADIATGQFQHWSDKHGRYDALGKSGQFGITKANIHWHLEHYLKDTLTYQEVADIYLALSESHADQEHDHPESLQTT